MTKRILILMLSLVVSAGLVAADTSPVITAEYPWELKKNQDGIRVSVRKVEGSTILEYRGTVTVNVGLEAVLRLFGDTGRMTEWFHQCVAARRIKAVTPDEEILYVLVSMPWPVQDRDLVFRRVRSKNPATGAVEYRSSSLPKVYPEEPGKIRMPYSKGFWRFTPLGNNRTEVYYQQHGEVGGHIPAWLVNQLVVNIPFNSLLRFRQLLSNTQG
jgi:START domain